MIALLAFPKGAVGDRWGLVMPMEVINCGFSGTIFLPNDSLNYVGFVLQCFFSTTAEGKINQITFEQLYTNLFEGNKLETGIMLFARINVYGFVHIHISISRSFQ